MHPTANAANWVAYSGGARNQGSRNWYVKAGAMLSAGLAVGMFVGGGLGALGGLSTVGTRSALGTILAGLLLLVSLLPRVPLLQHNAETSQRLLYQGPVRWALANGALLGAGFASRLGFWLWYLVPLSCFLSGRSWVGGAVYGTYSLVRLLPIITTSYAVRRWFGFDWASRALAARRAVNAGSRCMVIVLSLVCVFSLGS